MKNSKQIKVSINDGQPIVIDIVPDESISVYFESPPTMVWKGKRINKRPRLQVNGLRWRDGDHYHMDWLEKSLKVNDKITIEISKTSDEITKPKKDEMYIEPEETCMFCNKKKSEVECLVVKDYMARICNNCIDLAAGAVEKYRNAT